ncbi:ferritin-like domain-containing protein [Pseudonocardia sp. H11422]|uniref:ferritin-like domain-containing protein n=1 Tax=Pseudonocardia sp. H11422 TaxID=2835866 RepID=UPI001BDD7943|nr:ferritin-like domain-containing protein [Pseudonocardia sp. H11422]
MDEALLSDLALEHQLLDRARYLGALAEAAGESGVRRLAERLVTAHTATVDWLTTVLAEEALGGPTALRPTPLQRVAGGVTRAVNLPARVAVEGVNRALHTVNQTGQDARDKVGEYAGRVRRLGSGTREVLFAGRDAALQRAETVACRDGAGDTATTVHEARRDLGSLTVGEPPIRRYDELSVQEAVAGIKKLDRTDDINAVLRYEEAYKNRSGVVSAAHTRYAALAKEAAGVSAVLLEPPHRWAGAEHGTGPPSCVDVTLLPPFFPDDQRALRTRDAAAAARGVPGRRGHCSADRRDAPG